MNSRTVSATVVRFPRREHTTASPEPDRPLATVVILASRGAYTAAQDFEILRVPRATVYGWLRTGVIPAYRDGGRWVVPRRRFWDWLKSCEVPPVDGGPA
jgi:excisionase family DNA binding protein